MDKIKTFISLKEMKKFYKEKCAENGTKFSNEKFSDFVIFCEYDFFDWLKGNLGYYEPDWDC